MSKNRFLNNKTAADIDGRVERVLRGLGHPEPPLALPDVRELLKLDRAFYTAEDPRLTREVISRIRIAGIQVYRRPTLLLDAIRKASLQALYLPDRKRILLNGNLPEKKHRWHEAHEIGHSLIPWHEEVMLWDNSYTLSQDCHEQVEVEANFAAARLLFLRERFTDEARSLDPSIKAVRELHGIFGNTLSTTLYRFVETAGTERPMVGLITDHPHRMRRIRHVRSVEAVPAFDSVAGFRAILRKIVGSGPVRRCGQLLRQPRRRHSGERRTEPHRRQWGPALLLLRDVLQPI